jgi:cobaltochelatase CobS
MSVTLTSAERRTALKQALRAVANIADIADKAVGVRNLSSLTLAQLDVVATAAGVDVSTLAAPAAQPVPAVKPAKVAPAVAPVQPVQPVVDTVVDATAVDADVAAVLSSSFADMPAALRALALRANQPPRVVERVVERVVHASLPVSEDAGTVARPPVRSNPAAKPVRIAPASEVFGIAHPALDRITVAVYADPAAREIDEDYTFDPEVLALALWRLQHGQLILVTGPKGAGKTTFIEQIAAYLGRYFALLSFDRTTEIDPLIGQIELNAGNTFWRDGALTSAMRRPGAIILFDEPDCAKAGALAALHPVLADRSILIPRTGERVEAAEGVWFAAAANTMGHGDQTGTYVDRNLLDAAFRDRFADIIAIPYPPAQVERKILIARTGISRAAATILVDFARASRTRADKEQDIAAGIGLRRLIAWATGLRSGLNPDLIFRCTIVHQHNPEEGEVLWQLFKSSVDAAALAAAMSAADAPGEEQLDTDIL